MNRTLLRRGLAWCLIALVLVPLALAVVSGLGGLLAALGDASGAAVCGRVALGLGVVLVIVVVATTAVNAVAVLAAPRRRRRRRRRDVGPLGPDRITGAP